MLAEERQQQILALLQTQNVVSLQDICQTTNCSESSARRDLQQLEDAGKLVRVHGGAKLSQELQREPDMPGKLRLNGPAKMAIAKEAVKNVHPGDTIYLDAGTTTLAMIELLDPTANLTVVTNGVLHASFLADQGIRTLLLGGVLRNTTKAIVGTTAVRTLKQYRFNRVFLGTNGVHPTAGLTTPSPEEAVLKRAAAEQAEQVFVLADASKFDQTAFVRFGDCDLGTLITSTLPPAISDRYHQLATVREVRE